MTAPQQATFPAVTTDELVGRLDEAGLVVVDVRPLAAYNGWRLGEEVRGGHIPGAVAFPVSWLRTIDGEQVSSLLIEKGILNAVSVVVYGDGPADAGSVAWRLADLGPFKGLVAITRGGLVPAAIVARELNLRLIIVDLFFGAFDHVLDRAFDRFFVLRVRLGGITFPA